MHILISGSSSCPALLGLPIYHVLFSLIPVPKLVHPCWTTAARLGRLLLNRVYLLNPCSSFLPAITYDLFLPLQTTFRVHRLPTLHRPLISLQPHNHHLFHLLICNIAPAQTLLFPVPVLPLAAPSTKFCCTPYCIKLLCLLQVSPLSLFILATRWRLFCQMAL